MKRLFYFLIILLSSQAVAQTGQLAIDRVDKMPNLPSPYKMRNWKDVAVKYDQLIYNPNSTLQYFPLFAKRPYGINYAPLNPVLLDSYVGTTSHGNQAEAINIIPSIVGATLVGVNKSNQNGYDFTLNIKDFFNSSNKQNVYLNGYSTTSGNDWWYDVMPNVFFYQLYSQYPNTTDYQTQFTTVADRWLAAVNAMGGATVPWTVPQMNYRAFNLSTMKGLASGVREPESAGSISWLLYNAYKKTNSQKYLDGAQQSMEYLNSLTSSPSYELQLPYGTFIAAKMNAEIGTNYDIAKMLSWSFNRGPLRGWGTIVGNWNGNDVSGLIGEANDGGNDYAFALNGFQQAAAFVPLVKYDKRFARAIGKWALNLANASRLYYSKYLPVANQDDYTYSSTNDPESVIGYEALKQNNSGVPCVGTGDAKRGGWAATNLGVYGSSSVGYLAALVDTTNVSGILRLNINSTDFFGQNVYPSYLIYNPYTSVKQVTLPLDGSTYDIYDAISQQFIKTGVTGNTIIDVPADQALILTYLPQGSTPVAQNGKFMLGNIVVDYNYGYDFTAKVRIKSLAAKDSVLEYGNQTSIYSTVDNPAGTLTYKWYVNGTLDAAATTGTYLWTTPAVAGNYNVVLNVSNGTTSSKDSVTVKLVQRVPTPPVITGITLDQLWYSTSASTTATANATNSHGGALQYTWTFTGGTLSNQTGAQVTLTMPSTEGIFPLTVLVTNSDNLSASFTKQIVVRKASSGTTGPFAYYSFDGDVLDKSGNGHNGKLVGAVLTTDANGDAYRAYKFTNSADDISVANSTSLNFQTATTVSCWVKLDQVPEESFLISHGSWEERYKVSITPERKVRWTVKTSDATKDLDSSVPLNLATFYHITAVYTGYSMELYLNGALDSYVTATGLIQTTQNDMTFGHKDVNTNAYYLRGTLDEVRIYDKALAPNEIATLKNIFQPVVIAGVENHENEFVVYPNPARGTVYVSKVSTPVVQVEMIDITGRKINSSFIASSTALQVDFDRSVHGMMILKIDTGNGVVYRKIVAE